MIRSMIFEGFLLLCRAKGFNNKTCILFHMFQWVISRIWKIKFEKKEIKMVLEDFSFIFKTFSSEISPYCEIYIRKKYELDNNFVGHNGEIALDVGANIGIYAIRQAMRGVLVYAFEPNPDAFSRLKRNISLNHLERNIMPFCKAVHSVSGSTEFLIDPNYTTLGHVGQRDTSFRCITCKAISLDDFIPFINCKQINILKIDTEGNEFEILRGGGGIL